MSALLRTERITPIFASTFIQPLPQDDRSLRIRPSIERQQPAKSLLQKEVEKVKKAPEKEGIPWYYLSGTGFFVKEQVSQIVKSVKEAKKLGKSVDEAI